MRNKRFKYCFLFFNQKMADIYELEQNLTDPASNVREDMFKYLFSQRVFGNGITEGQARIEFTLALDDYDKTRILAQSYLPVYNQCIQKSNAAQTQTAGDLRKRLTTAAVCGFTGLAAIVLSPIIEHESARTAVQLAGATAFVSSGVGVGIVYLKNLLKN